MTIRSVPRRSRGQAKTLRVLGAAGVAGLTGLTWALAEAQAFTVRRVQMPVLAAGAQPLRILHLSDLHLRPGQSRKIAWLRHLEELQPDLVINTGDNMAHARALPAVLDALEPLLSRPGVFVPGSNDFFSPQMKNPARYFLRDPRRAGDIERQEDLPGGELAHALAAAGWLDLTNRTGTVELPNTRLEFVGVDDPHLERDVLPSQWQHGNSAPDVPPLRIGVAHAPYLRVLTGMQQLGCQAVFAGHTHGGQLCVPGYGALVTNCDLDRGRVSGLHGWPGPSGDDPNSLWLHVSNGVGTSPFTPVRFACRPSVTLVTLSPR